MRPFHITRYLLLTSRRRNCTYDVWNISNDNYCKAYQNYDEMIDCMIKERMLSAVRLGYKYKMILMVSPFGTYRKH